MKFVTGLLMPYTYILLCSDETLYTGWTSDLEKRLVFHDKGKSSKYTRARLPVKLIFYEQYEPRSECQKRECKIKKMSKEEKNTLIKHQNYNNTK